MKITENDLEQSVQTKLNQLENIKTNTANPTYITYENNTFVKKNINELNMSRVISTDEIYQLSKHLYKSEDNYISAYDTSLISGSGAYASSALLSNLVGSFAFQTESEILKVKTYSGFIIALCTNGYVYKIDRSNTSIQTKKNILDIIKMNFVYQNFDVYSIIDFDYYSDGLLIATEEHGIFFISLEREEYSIAVQELYVEHIKVLSDRKTLLITKYSTNNNIVLFNLELGTKISSFNQLGIDHQTALSIDVCENEFFILGKTSAVNQDNDLVHHWKLDAAEINYENLDRYVAANPCDNVYRPKLIKSDTSNVYVIGTKEKTLFVWEYNRANMNTAPVELLFNLQEFTYDDIKDFVNINNKYYITLKNQILVLDKNFNLLENYLLNGKSAFKSAKITPSGIYAIYDKECYSFYIPEKTYQKTIDVQILNNEADCNNIDIMVKASNKDTLLFLNGDTAQKIVPYFYIKMDEKFHIVKLLNCAANNIIMRVNITEETDQIQAVVIHKNRIFYK